MGFTRREDSVSAISFIVGWNAFAISVDPDSRPDGRPLDRAEIDRLQFG